jgi:hypothetical protein
MNMKRIILAATAAIGVVGCSHPVPPAAAIKTVTKTVAAPSTTAPSTTAPSTPTPLASRIVRLTFPVGSTVGREPDGFESWTVPREPLEEIADVRAQLPVNQPYDGLPWCSEDKVRNDGTGMQWSWGAKQDFLVVSVTPEFKGTPVPTPGVSDVVIVRRPDDTGDTDCAPDQPAEPDHQSAGTTRANDQTDDAFVKDLQARGITLPASVSPMVLGTTVCVYMREGHSLIETGYNLMREGFQGMTFTGPQAGDVAVEAHLHYCPNQPLTGGE